MSALSNATEEIFDRPENISNKCYSSYMLDGGALGVQSRGVMSSKPTLVSIAA